MYVCVGCMCAIGLLCVYAWASISVVCVCVCAVFAQRYVSQMHVRRSKKYICDLLIQTRFLTEKDVFKGKCKHCQRRMHEDTTVLSLVESSTMSNALFRASCMLHMG
jgi:hypothetical protein